MAFNDNGGLSDEQLLLRARGGDRDALQQLLLRHGPPLRPRIEINPKWRSVLEPNDILQVTYFEAFLQFDRFKGDARAFPGWLWRVTENNLRDAIQALEREKRPQPGNRLTAPDDAGDFAWLNELLTGGLGTPSWHAMGKELRQFLESEVDSLPRDWRSVLRWTFFDGLSVSEIADKMNKTTGAVHLIRIRAVARLRERFGSDSRFLSDH
ncbi:MAG TPA: sigma-70 family RNA polymerase sigma factor [Phycisphaerae bacterium]|nr:sigma-70 family RNA polymerase sigma factor [Phycisphaerae bacterium]